MPKKIDKELIDPKVEPEGEKVHRVARAAASAIPVLGGPAVEAFRALIEPPMERRRTKWMVDVTDAINDLYERGLVTESDLQEDEEFFSTLVHASNVAIRNHQEEKLQALRNAVLNSALPSAPDETLQKLFLNLIDTFTTWHLHLLRLFHSPEQWAVDHDHTFPSWSSGGITSVIESAFPTLTQHKAMYRLIWQDLHRSGLVNTDNLGITMTGTGMMAKRTTDIGDQFLRYISEP